MDTFKSFKYIFYNLHNLLRVSDFKSTDKDEWLTDHQCLQI